MKDVLLKLPSCPASLSEVEKFVRKISSRYNIDQEMFPNILISLTEAVNNAIMHGNHGDENKYVNIKLRKTEWGLCLKVSDEGNGFNPNQLIDPTTPENIACCGGRGVFLIKQLSDRVKFYNNGSTVEMHFHI